jgi:hypothetical protein
MQLSKPWTVYLIHHAHTDIGYTDRQEKISRYHVDFIRQAIHILDEYHNGKRPEFAGFVWQCENFWQVKNFYHHAGVPEIARFEHYVKSGEIGLSGNYLNMTELIDDSTLRSRLSQAQSYAQERGITLRSAMTADINGFAWGYSEALYQAGIHWLFSCLHGHHGVFPLRKKQMPFYWETPAGNKILVWNGDHYHLGNSFAFAPNATSHYTLYDEYTPLILNNLVFNKDAAHTEEEELTILENRLERYLHNLDEEQYPLSLVPFMVSGTLTDNAPPNGFIAERARCLSERYAGRLTIKMSTLEGFFQDVEALNLSVPTYRGDWNDWWADGVGSTPEVVKHYREAQRKVSLYTKLGGSEDARLDEVRENLMLYAEHTWGYATSVSEPWETLVKTLELRKTGYAIDAYTGISRLLDERLAEKGEVSIRQGKKQVWRVINPHNLPLKQPVSLPVYFWEYIDGVRFNEQVCFELVDKASGERLSTQTRKAPWGLALELTLELQPHEERTLALRALPPKQGGTVLNHAYIGAEGVQDIIQPGEYRTDYEVIETDDFRLRFDQQHGLTELVDKQSGQSLLDRAADYAAFSGIYEITPVQSTPCEERRLMGRNRKTTHTHRAVSQLTGIQVVEAGPVFILAQLDYALEGTRFYQVFLKIYRHIPFIEAKVRIHKTSEWDPENLYVSLPFTAGRGDTRYFEKTGCLMRPGLDQLPGTNQLFYLTQNGIICAGTERFLLLTLKDTPLITLGSLEAHPIDLSHDESWELNRSPLFAWVMNNFWETNFRVDLGGFYEFSFGLGVCAPSDMETARQYCVAQNEGLISMSVE